MATIFIVDDDPDVIDACSLVLKREGHRIVSANSRNDGMALLKQETPDLLILDVMMEQPDDGIAMAQELRRMKFSAPILMLTSISKATGYSYGKDDELIPVDAFEEKPLDPNKLISIVGKLLKKKES